MSQFDAEEKLLPEATEEQADSQSRLVPVAESIRYRKRAQNAEKEAKVLAEQLEQVQAEFSKAQKDMDNLRDEQKLIRKLSSSGVADLEAAVLIVKARMQDDKEADLDSVVEQLKNEKQYLFGKRAPVVSAGKTSPAKDRMVNNQTVLEKAARRAAGTGSRTDLQQYLKLRRNFL